MLMERYQLNISWICNVLPAEAAEQSVLFFFCFVFFTLLYQKMPQI